MENTRIAPMTIPLTLCNDFEASTCCTAGDRYALSAIAPC